MVQWWLGSCTNKILLQKLNRKKFGRTNQRPATSTGVVGVLSMVEVRGSTGSALMLVEAVLEVAFHIDDLFKDLITKDAAGCL